MTKETYMEEIDFKFLSFSLDADEEEEYEEESDEEEYEDDDDYDDDDDERYHHVRGRKRFGRIAIANCDAAGDAVIQAAIEQAHRAIVELS